MPIVQLTQSQDEFKIRSIDVVHINPSIMEGERGGPSILGPGSAIPIVRYAPVYLVLPTISGEFKIPSVLTCNPGVTDASPKGLVFYQWLADGVEILGETSSTMTTLPEHDAKNMTCRVDVVNYLGVAIGLSNGIIVEIVEPIILEEQDIYTTTGLGQKTYETVFGYEQMVVTSMAIETQLSNLENVVFAVSGMINETVEKASEFPIFILSGMPNAIEQEVALTECYVVSQP